MCIFSQTVESVSNTRIFARRSGERQLLAYEMHLVSHSDLAMILPIPTSSQHEADVKFFNLQDYASFFDDMARCFPVPVSRSNYGAWAVAGAGQRLAVHDVGAFEASFVPTQGSFARLDPRFRLAEGVWRQLPAYEDFGFAVFQLRAGFARIHPMAFSFSTRNPRELFFPTAHVHDGSVHAQAEFDHTLYAQVERTAQVWEVGSVLPRAVMNFGNLLISDRTRGLVEKDVPIVRRKLEGAQKNEDIWLFDGGAS